MAGNFFYNIICIGLTLCIASNIIAQQGTFSSVGIGTSSPQYPLHIINSGQAGLAVESSGNEPSVFLLKSNNKLWHWSKRGSGENDALKLHFYNGSAFTYPAALALVPNGDMGVGTEDPKSKLDVFGNIQLSGGALPAALILEEAQKQDHL